MEVYQRSTHSLERDHDLRIVAGQGIRVKMQRKRTTHLTVEWCRSVEVNEVEDRGNKNRCARKGVNLRNVLISPSLRGGDRDAKKRLSEQTHIVFR